MRRIMPAMVVLASITLALPAAGQISKTHRIGVLGESPPSSPAFAPLWQGFVTGLRDNGWTEGRNIVIETRFAGEQPERFAALAAELVAAKAELIVAFGSRATEAARQSTTTIPIVMIHASHPVASGLARSLARPGGNVTGISNPLEDITAKHLELLQEARPAIRRVAVLYNPEGLRAYYPALEAASAAQRAGISATTLSIIEPKDIASAFTATREIRAQALIIYPSALVEAQVQEIARLAIGQQIPTISPLRTLAEHGLLMSYGPDHAESWRRAAYFVDRILRGAKPSEMPIEEPTKFELVINAKTARALSIEIPPTLFARADEVIE
ncbi:MAG TPA: ABC transporter substrate-binding protein [Alphaproteobacteria bacterium]|nr:ABC transporter substrate-binding protein [Alphaproteobacteria bacterium]